LRTLKHIKNGGKTINYMSIEDAIKLIPSGSTIYPANFAGTPAELLKEVCRQVESGRLNKVHFLSVMIEGGAPWDDPKFYDKITSNTMFATGSNRKLIQSGHGDYTPMLLSEIAKYYRDFRVDLDVAMATISPPDEHGNCSLGIAGDCSVEAMRNAKIIIGEEIPTMPRTFGDTQVHASQFDAIVKTNRPMFAAPDPKPGATPDPDAAKIGKMIAEELIEDESTLQIGIGAITDAACGFLKNHKNLGIHTELLSDGMVELMKQGVITNACKTVDPGLSVTSLAYGTNAFYKYINNNPVFRMLLTFIVFFHYSYMPSYATAILHMNYSTRAVFVCLGFRSAAYTNDPAVIQKNHKMVSINACIEIDLTGQVASDSIGTRIYSGIGGQLDYVYGASSAPGGKAIMALESTTGKGATKIVPFLNKGAGVVATRGNIQYVVTEYGIADLWGKSLRQRAYQLINLAHPNHRESLEKSAFEMLKCMPSP
uniref:Acetyl-CoA hydrolase n=1 Tax=Anisakis simplex TaxID=6269 RepID=A0A0M3K8Y5_ANISI